MKHFKLGKHHHNYTEPDKPRSAQHDVHDDPHDSKHPFRIVTFNIKHSLKIAKAIHMFTDHDELKKSQIICLQEMDHNGAKAIANALKMNFVYYPAIRHPRKDKDFGNAILSKWPIVDDFKVILPQIGAGRLQRIAVGAVIKIGKENVLVFSVHLKVFVRQKHRRYPIDAIIASIPKKIKSCVIAGDFNSFTKSNARSYIEPLLNADFNLATKDVHWTYRYWYLLNKTSLLDYIFIKNLKTTAHGKAPSYKASDHLPIWADLKLTS